MKKITTADLQAPDSPGDGWYIIEAAGRYPTRYEEGGTVYRFVQDLTPQVLAAIAERGVPPEGVLVDRDHFSTAGDKPSEALGWLRELAVCGDDLAGFIEWTPLGLPLVCGKVYRHFSTVYPSDPEQIRRGVMHPDRLVGLALTNKPNNTPGQPPITNRGLPGTQQQTQQQQIQPGNKTMNPEILALLGLPEGAADEDVLAAIRSLKEGADAAAQAEADAIVNAEEEKEGAELENDEKEECREQILTNREHGIKYTRLLCNSKARRAAAPAGRRYGDPGNAARREVLVCNRNTDPGLARAARVNARAREICEAERRAGRNPNWHVAHARASRETK